jgi:hypothetical protein
VFLDVGKHPLSCLLPDPSFAGNGAADRGFGHPKRICHVCNCYIFGIHLTVPLQRNQRLRNFIL